MTSREAEQAVTAAILAVGDILHAKNWEIAGCQLSRITSGPEVGVAYVRAVRRLDDTSRARNSSTTIT